MHGHVLQMCTSSRPWANLSHAQILSIMLNGAAQLVWPGHEQLNIPDHMHQLANQVADLGRRCLSATPSARPTMGEVVKELIGLLMTWHGQPGEGKQGTAVAVSDSKLMNGHHATIRDDADASVMATSSLSLN